MKTLSKNILSLQKMLKRCRLCPRQCGVDRTTGEIGACRVGPSATVVSTGPHFGEEKMLVGRGGSGTIFFSGCNLHCVFCQNYDISQTDIGDRICPSDQLAEMALKLQEEGCENINFVSPTHVIHVVAEAICIARSEGLRVPTVYNSGGYESVEVLKKIEGLIDIYMPDFKYSDAAMGQKYSGVKKYPTIAADALEEMYRQTGSLEINNDGVAVRGVLVRHLVMPNQISGSEGVIEIVADRAPGCAINVMGQYRPAYKTGAYPELMSRPSMEDVSALRAYAQKLGLVRVDH